jgi:hypothetical protein
MIRQAGGAQRFGPLVLLIDEDIARSALAPLRSSE